MNEWMNEWMNENEIVSEWLNNKWLINCLINQTSDGLILFFSQCLTNNKGTKGVISSDLITIGYDS